MSTAGDGALRIGDRERERAAADLAEHYAAGRLSADEHAERLERVWAARTESDLRPLFRDLPGPAATTAPAYAGRPGPRRPAPAWGGPPAYWRSGPVPFRRGRPTPVLLLGGGLVALVAFAHLPVLLAVLIGVAALAFAGRGRHRRSCA